MKHSILFAIRALLLLSVLSVAPAGAQSTFTIADPPVDFQVIDADPFDGIGDNGPYDTYSDVLLGTLGEIRSMAEFDISGFSIPPGETIVSATLEARITAIEIYGLGVNGETPDHLLMDGYACDGLAELADFQAGDGNTLDEVATPDPYIGQVVSFDVTAYVAEVAGSQGTCVGLSARAGSFGGLWLSEGNGYPKLTIETMPVSAAQERGGSSLDLALRQNVPNPFAGSTWIEYRLPREADGPPVLTILDASGRLVRSLPQACDGAGVCGVPWDGRDAGGVPVPSGIYYYRLDWNGMVRTRSMQLLR